MKDVTQDWAAYVSRSPAERTYRPPAPPGGPGAPVQIVFSFDTTGQSVPADEVLNLRLLRSFFFFFFLAERDEFGTALWNHVVVVDPPGGTLSLWRVSPGGLSLDGWWGQPRWGVWPVITLSRDGQ